MNASSEMSTQQQRYRDVRKVTLHYLSGEIDVELDLPIEILQDTSEAKHLVLELKQAIVALPYIRDVKVRFKV